MGLSWQTGPLSRGAIGLFFVPGPLPKRLLYASRCAGACACASAEPGSPIARMSSCRSNLCRCPVAYFAETDVSSDTLHRTEQTSRHPEPRSHLLVHRPSGRADRTARGAFAWHAMDAFHEEDERIQARNSGGVHRQVQKIFQSECSRSVFRKQRRK